MSKLHTIEVYDYSDSHYKYYDTDDFEIDGHTLEEHDKQIRADAIDEFADSIVIKIGLLKQSADDEWVEYALNEIKKFVMNKAYELKEQTE